MAAAAAAAEVLQLGGCGKLFGIFRAFWNVLGGIFDSENSKGTSKIPVLGDLPYVKRLFSGTTDRNRKTELLIFITPRLVSDSLTGR